MTSLSPAEFLTLPHPAQRQHLRALALEAKRVDVSRGDVQRARDALVELCALLDDETPTPDCHVRRVGELIGELKC